VDGSTVKMSIKMIGGTFEGKLSGDGKTIDGNWSQGPSPMALTLARATPETEWTIPAAPPPVPAMAADADPSLEVATIKPSDPSRQGKGFGFRGTHFMTFNTNMNDLIAFAYGLHSKQIIDAPPWFGTELYDIDGVPDAPGRPNLRQMGIMVQKLLPVEVPPRPEGTFGLRDFGGQRWSEDDENRGRSQRSAGLHVPWAWRPYSTKHEHDGFCIMDAIRRDG
jgi:hypothetical protein